MRLHRTKETVSPQEIDEVVLFAAQCSMNFKSFQLGALAVQPNFLPPVEAENQAHEQLRSKINALGSLADRDRSISEINLWIMVKHKIAELEGKDPPGEFNSLEDLMD
jgi:hypothetical protein